MQYIAKTRIKKGNEVYEEGQIIDLSDSEAAELLEHDAVTKVDLPFAAIIKTLGDGQ